MEILEKLKNIDFEDATPDDVRSILYSVTLPAIKSKVVKGTYIVRARRGDGYTKRSQMTYCPVNLCTSLQRATLAGQTMFYGVIADDQSHLENARAISSAECSKLTRGGKKSIGREKFTLSYWEVIEPLNVVSFIADTTNAEVHDNKLLNDLRNVFRRESFTDQERELIRFISGEFSKVVTDNNEYLISATLASDIISKTEIDGIVFPSVQLGGQAGLNIALSPNAVDSKLCFKYTIEETLYKNKDKTVIMIENDTDVNGCKKSHLQMSDELLCKILHITNIEDLPFI